MIAIVLATMIASSIGAGVAAAKQQSAICQKVSDLQKQQITAYNTNQALIAKIKQNINVTEEEIATVNEDIANILIELNSAQTNYQNSYKLMEVVAIIFIIFIGILLLLKKLGIFSYLL